MRGKDVKRTILRSISRITPAHAGKRYLVFGDISLSKDHPRTCGEKKLLRMFF